MADVDRTVRVSGLPTDIEDDRLSDKLHIFFLRERHGGGEIASVIIIKDPPGSALITFEDSTVARRVILHGQHVLNLDGMQYELTLTPHCQRLGADMVVLSMSVTIDCTQLPLRQKAKRVLLQSYPDITFKDSTSRTSCKITGPYSQVQAALAQLLELPGCQKSEDTRSTIARASSGGLNTHAVPKSQSPDSLQAAGDYRSTPRGHQKSTGPVWEDVDKTETGAMALQLSKDPKMLEEDLSLVMDADMFKYLQKHCGKEYRHILSQNGVEVLDVTSEDVTTLFLQCDTPLGEVDLKRLKSARSQISQLYQDNETKICRVHLLKSTLPSSEVLHRIMENLGVTLPKLLLNEDDQNIYLIGSYSDTSEAKKVLWDYNEPRRVSDEIGSLLRSTSVDLNSAYPLEGQNGSVALPPIPGSPRSKTDALLGPNKDESRADGATKYKLAAQFTYTRPGALGSLLDDFTGVGLGLPPPAVRRGLGPVLGSDVLSGTARFTDKSLSRQNTGEDVLFESAVRPSQSSTSGDYERKFSGSPPIPTQISPSGSVTRPALGTGLGLNYDSISAQISIPMVQTARRLDDAEHTGRAKETRTRDRANSFSHLKGEQITVSSMIWKYINEVYWPQLVGLTTDIKMEEQDTDASGQTTVFLTALDSSKVRACQIDLQNLVAKVTADLMVYDLNLTELGVADPADELLAVCCDEVRSRFKKVSIHTFNEFISILGPRHLCPLVADALREVFSVQIPGQQQCFSSEASTLASTSNEAISPTINKDQHLSPFDSNATEHKQEINPISISEHTDYIQSSDVSNVSLLPKPPMAQKETVMKEKVKSPGTTHSRRRSTVSQANTIIDSSAKPLDDSGPQAKDTSDTQSRLLQNDNRRHGWSESQQYTEASSPYSNSGRSGQQGFKNICLYCSSEESERLECGLTICPGCVINKHAHCRVCRKKTQCKGIQGSISFSELSVSLPCHNKDSTLKITYDVSNGIQGDSHPSPGLPFTGGVFVAYLPYTPKVRKLMPRLQEAFKRGLTFTVQGKEGAARVTWDCIPHKTSIQGGKSQNGYPDATYLARLSDILTSHGV